jgi:spermidine/putrescine transport system ATP-binding protein
MTATRVGAGGSTGATGGGTVDLVGLSKRYGDQLVLKGIDLTIPAGQFFSLLGPSGCGKTTTLRLIGGFERPDEGQVLLDGGDVSGVPPERRPVNTVFQSYALFPHLSVADNVAFGLRFNGSERSSAKQRVSEALELVRLGQYAKRKPHQLSGGQQQRVALARALVLRPRVLLLDEPLGALDAKLRKALQLELTSLQREVGITFVYVTHDQEEALTMSDRLAVMKEGEVEQVGTPREIYEHPRTAYVADFLGVANLLPAEQIGGGRVRVAGAELDVTGDVAASGACHVVVRPERVRLVRAGDGGANSLRCIVDKLVYVGAVTQVHLRVGDAPLQALVANDGVELCARQGEPVDAQLPRDAVRLVTD